MKFGKKIWINNLRLQIIKTLQIQRHWRNYANNPQYKLAQNMSLGLNIDFMSFSDKVSSKNDYSELKGMLKLKIGF